MRRRPRLAVSGLLQGAAGCGDGGVLAWNRHTPEFLDHRTFQSRKAMIACFGSL